jgi:hypothetical protein
MSPDEQAFKEWLEHPVTEWVHGLTRKFAEKQKAGFAETAWTSGEFNQRALDEARTRADCYLGLSETSYESWKAIDDSEA